MNLLPAKSRLDKISSIEVEEFYEEIPVYDLEVPETHNFVLANGLVVHNCKDISDSVIGNVYTVIAAGEEATVAIKPNQSMNTYLDALKNLSGASKVHGAIRVPKPHIYRGM